jgi:xanthine dehydrogenase YagS FAD-binding subunit
MAVALAALDARVQLQGPDGDREIAFTDLHRLPGDDPSRDTVLNHGELITAIDVPPLPEDTRSAYRKIRDRASYAFALVSVAAVLRVADGRVADVRLALGGVAHKPWRASRAEEALLGQPATEEHFRAAAEAELAAAQPQPGLESGNAFKVPLAVRTMTATLRQLTQEA